MVFIHVGSLLAFLPGFTNGSAIVLFLFLYWLTASIGICAGYHRHLSHKAFSCSQTMTNVLAFIGSLACQQGPISWVSNHRNHHRYSDRDGDPHDASRGFFFSHVGWLMKKRNPDHNNVPQFVLAGILFLIGGPAWVVWGIFIRLVMVYHVTWFINSVCHASGYKNYDINDLSTNNFIVSLLTFGEGNHNNHHRFPISAKSSIRFFEIDMTYWSIIILKKFKLISNVRIKP